MCYMSLGKICPGACSTYASTVPLVECQVSLCIADTSSGAGVFLIDLIKIRAHVAYALLPGDFFCKLCLEIRAIWEGFRTIGHLDDVL